MPKWWLVPKDVRKRLFFCHAINDPSWFSYSILASTSKGQQLTFYLCTLLSKCIISDVPCNNYAAMNYENLLVFFCTQGNNSCQIYGKSSILLSYWFVFPSYHLVMCWGPKYSENMKAFHPFCVAQWWSVLLRCNWFQDIIILIHSPDGLSEWEQKSIVCSLQ